MIRWEAPGPYVVGFTTRQGGVSEGPFASLNLGSRHDDPDRVVENRRIACEELGVDPTRLAVNRQRHTTRVVRASVDERAPADGFWSDEPGMPMLAMSADCVPIAIASTAGSPALAVVHAGWRGLADGVVAAAVRAMGATETAAVVGPAIGPCCYEVGPEVSGRFDADLTSAGMLDLWTTAERTLRAAGVASVERLDLCTRCDPTRFFSYRRSGPPHGAQGVIGALVG
jgi:hypothetical protein